MQELWKSITLAEHVKKELSECALHVPQFFPDITVQTYVRAVKQNSAGSKE
jgi:hypothetical protein